MSADIPRALAALRDADQFLHVCRLTYVRELEEARDDRERGNRALLGAAARALAGPENADDGVVAQQELREAIEQVGKAAQLIAEGAPARSALVSALRSDDVRREFLGRVDALERAVRSAYAAVHAEAPDEPGLPTWGHDAEDAEIAKAAGAGMQPVHYVVGGLAIVLLILDILFR